MRKVVIVVFATVGVLSLLCGATVLAFMMLSLMLGESVPAKAIVEIDFERGVIEKMPDDVLAHLTMERSPELRDVVDALDRAAADSRVLGVFARIGGRGMGLAHLQELRDAVERFRASGKPAVAFAETFGEFGPGNGGYYLATAFDRIYLQPSGDVGLTGLMYESPFVRGLLDKLEVRPQLDQRYEYKNAMNFYTERGFTEPHERALRELMESQFAQIVRGISAGRGFDDEQHVRELFDRAPFLGEDALEAGLVDGLAYYDEALDELLEDTGRAAQRIDVSHYLSLAGRPNRRGQTIALIQGYGTITRGASSYSPVDGSITMGSDTLAEAFRAAIDDRRVQAIVFRVDSPGGSFVASDTIWRETVRARNAGKPVIVSMGNLAASGGYFVSIDADKIVAEPGTITASIGVLGGKLVTREFWAKLGVTWDDVHTSDNSTMWSPAHPYAGASYEKFQAMLDRIYAEFTGRVAQGRQLPLERVREIARGRIWTGEDALRLGLVDELGGVEVALRLAREAAGLAPDAPVRLRRFPARRSTWELFFERAEGTEDGALAGALRPLRALEPALALLRRLGVYGDPAPLVAPDVGARF